MSKHVVTLVYLNIDVVVFRSWTSDAMKYESKNAWTEAKSAETTPMAEQTIAIDDTKGIAINANVTAKPDDGNVTEITIEQVHPSVQPSIQGHGQGNETEREGEIDR